MLLGLSSYWVPKIVGNQHITPSFNPAFIGEYATATSLNGENYLYKSDIGVLIGTFQYPTSRIGVMQENSSKLHTFIWRFYQWFPAKMFP